MDRSPNTPKIPPRLFPSFRTPPFSARAATRPIKRNRNGSRKSSPRSTPAVWHATPATSRTPPKSETSSMDEKAITRRDLLKKSGKFILLTSAAAAAWEFVLEGKAEAAPNYDVTKHWWAMLIDPEKCIGCGNCV